MDKQSDQIKHIIPISFVGIAKSNLKPSRPDKGRSLLCFPESYTVIDVETTGHDPRWDEIIEVAALRVQNGTVVDSFSSLVRPTDEISEFITELTGISNDDVVDAPEIGEILPAYRSFIGESVIVGHNVNFDINFLYDASVSEDGAPITNDFVDTLRLSRRLLPELKHHRLCDVAKALDVSQKGAHRSLVDCETTFEVFCGLKAKADAAGIVFNNTESRRQRRARLIDVAPVEGMEQPDSPLYGKVCVFTGSLEKFSRKNAMQLVVNLGGICGERVTAKTNFLIQGDKHYSTTIKDGKSSKRKKAERLILSGSDLQIISESVFYDLVLDSERES